MAEGLTNGQESQPEPVPAAAPIARRREFLRIAASPWLAGLLPPVLATATQAVLPRDAQAQPAPKTFTFVVIGDTPYSSLEEPALQRVLAAQDPGVAFIIHVGDLKSGLERCSDDLIRHRHALLAAAPAPLIFVPGDNEWVDCARLLAGGFEPLERLALLRRLFHDDHAAVPAVFERFARQSQLTPLRHFPEHLRWLHQGIAFLTVNLPGSHNARSDDPELVRANVERIAAIQQWLEQGREWAVTNQARALVVVGHANPGFDRDPPGRPPRAPNDPDDAYAWWRAALRRLAQRWPLPILLVHGDTHRYRYDKPLRDDSGKLVRNLARLESFGAPHANAWLRVTASAGQPPWFGVQSRELDLSGQP